MTGYKVMKRTRMCFERTDRAIGIGSLIICYMLFLTLMHFGSDYFVLISQHNLGEKINYIAIYSAYPAKGEQWLYNTDMYPTKRRA